MKSFIVGYFKSDSSTRSIFLSRHQILNYIELKLCALKQVKISWYIVCPNSLVQSAHELTPGQSGLITALLSFYGSTWTLCYCFEFARCVALRCLAYVILINKPR